MRLALVGSAADSGVGRELIDAARNLPASCAFIIPDDHKPTRADLLAHLDLPHTIASPGRRRLAAEMADFLGRHRPDTVLTWESPGSWSFPPIWSSGGVRWVCVVHRDWFDPGQTAAWRGATLVSPNRICRRELKERHGLESVLLDVPVDARMIRFRERATASRFVSVYGYGGPAERRSLREILAAWSSLRGAPPLVVRAQRWPDEIAGLDLPPGVSVALGTADEPADLFADADVAVQVSRYEGVGTTLMEAQAAGLPVVAVDAEPMRDVAPLLLVSPERAITASVGRGTVEAHVPSARHLAEIVSSLAGRDISDLSRRARAHAESRSWDALRERWMNVLSA